MSLRLFTAAFAVTLAGAPLVTAAAKSNPPQKHPAPASSPSPAPAPSCQFPPGTEDDPKEQALMAQCRADLTRIDSEKNRLADNMALAEGSTQSLQQMLRETAKAIVDNRQHQAELTLRIQDLERQASATAKRMEVTTALLARRRLTYATFTRNAYEKNPDAVSYLMQSGGISDFMRRSAAVMQVRSFGLRLLTDVKQASDQLRDETDRIAQDRARAASSQQQLAAARRMLVQDEVRESIILTALQQSIGDAQKEMADASTQTADLVARIVAAQIERQDQLIQMANEAAWQAAQAWMQNNQAVFAPSAGHSTKYPFIWPAQHGVISQGFGPTDYSAEPPGFGAAHFHAGIDVANASGTQVLAADDGVVAAVDDSMLGKHEIGYGKHVIIAHRNGMMTLYGHLEGWVVKVGDKVTQGQLIGFMGSTGNSSGPHLHFELRINNTPTDPAPDLPPHGPNDFHA